MNKVSENIPVRLNFSLNLKESIHNFFRRKMVVRIFTYLPDFLFKKYKDLAKLILKCHETFENKLNHFPEMKTTIYGGDKLLTLKKLEIKQSSFKQIPTTFKFTQKNSLEAAREIKDGLSSPDSVGILNMGNRRQPGGVGRAPYGGSQEEYLIRRSNLAWALDPHFSNDLHEKMKKMRRSEHFKDEDFAHHIPYFGAVVTQNVSFIDQDKPDQFDVISAAAPDLRKNSDESLHLKKFGATAGEVRKKILKHKIQAICASAAAAKINHLVLGAFGTGCFENDTKEVAEIFYKVLNSNKYKNRFANITFAITDSKKLDIFKRVFSSNIDSTSKKKI